MKHILKKIFLSNAQIKIISLLLGYSFWYIFSQAHIARIWVEVPICFYQLPQNFQVEAPEKIRIQLSGKRSDLYTIDMETLAFHIYMQEKTKGTHVLKLSEQQLFLPNSIKMVRCYPANIAVHIKEMKTTAEQRNQWKQQYSAQTG